MSPRPRVSQVTRILIIDDEPAVAAAISKILAREGFEVTSVRDGPAGIAAAEAAPLDVVITDIMMPRMNGVTVIEQIRRLQPRARIVAISGGGNFAAMGYQSEAITTTAYLAAAQQAGADVVLTKPFDRTELLETVRGLAGAER